MSAPTEAEIWGRIVDTVIATQAKTSDMEVALFGTGDDALDRIADAHYEPTGVVARLLARVADLEARLERLEGSR